MKEDQALVFLSGANRMVDKLRTVGDCKEVADKAAAVAFWARRAGKSLDLVNDAQEYRLRAERKGGELLLSIERDRGRRPKNSRHGETNFSKACKEAGGSTRATRWQAEASIPEPEFERWTAEIRAKGEELSSNALRKVAKERQQKERIVKIKRQAGKEKGPKEGLVTDLAEYYGKIRCLYMDPNWAYDDSGCRGAAAHHYETLPLADLVKQYAEPVRLLLHPKGAHVWCWTTIPMLLDCVPQKFLAECGLACKGAIVWDKEIMAGGRWLRSLCEVLVLAIPEKGPKLPRLVADQVTFVEEVIHEKAEKGHEGAHSKKPQKAYEVIERFSPGPRLELFARHARKDWLRHGFEA